MSGILRKETLVECFHKVPLFPGEGLRCNDTSSDEVIEKGNKYASLQVKLKEFSSEIKSLLEIADQQGFKKGAVLEEF